MDSLEFENDRGVTMLDDYQMARMELESRILRQELPQFTLHFGRYTAPYAAGRVTTTVDRNVYELKLDIGLSCLDCKPKLFVTYPKILKGYRWDKPINKRGTSHAFHTWNNGPGGIVQICHSKHWDASKSCVDVLVRGLLWLELYDAYRRDGRTIAEHLA